MTGELSSLEPLTDLLAQIRDLKRVRDARSPRSLAERQFGRAWARLVAGEDVETVALSEAAAALAAVRLAGLDAGVLMAHGLSAAAATEALRHAFDDVAAPVHASLRDRLRATLGPLSHPEEPAVVDLLVRQPRAGATHPGLPRLVLEPAESHADHCATVAVFGVLLAPRFGANPAEAFLTGLAHHLFNTSLPDAGFAADSLLGEETTARLAAVATDRALGTLPEKLRPALRDALARTRERRFEEPAARAFHAADVLDRVLEMAWHERAARFRLADALGSDTAAGQLNVCHDGFYQSFQRDVLAAAGLGTDGASGPAQSASRRASPSGSFEAGGHGGVPAASPLAGGPGAEDGRILPSGTEIAHLERREMGS